MPNGDMTGPKGLGAMTGRARGCCGEIRDAGPIEEPGSGRGNGRGRGCTGQRGGMRRGMGQGGSQGCRQGRGQGQGQGRGQGKGGRGMGGRCGEQGPWGSELERVRQLCDALDQVLATARAVKAETAT